MDNEDVTRVKDLSSRELRALIQGAVEQVLLDLLGDPDHGLNVREDLHARLRDSLERVRRGERGAAAADELAGLDKTAAQRILAQVGVVPLGDIVPPTR